MDVIIYAFYWTKPKVAYVGMTANVGQRWAGHAYNLQEHLPAYKPAALDAYNLYGMPKFRRLCVVHDQAKSHTEQVKHAEQAAYERLRDAGWTMCNWNEPAETYFDGMTVPSNRQRMLSKNIRCKFGTGKIYRYLTSVQVGDKMIEDWMHFVIDKANMAVFYVWDTRQALFQIDANLLPKTYIRTMHDSFEPIIGLDNFVLTCKSDATKAKFAMHNSLAQRGSHKSPEACRRMSESRKGKKMSAEWKRAQSERITLWWQNRRAKQYANPAMTVNE